MKTNKLLFTAILVASSMTVWAQTNVPEATYNGDAANDEDVFRAQEFSLDLFGTVSVGQHTINHISGDRIEDNGRLGAGAGLNYFFDRHIGIGADAYTENTDHFFVDSASGNLIVRFPFDAIRLAPYVFGGGGHQFDPLERWFGQVGAGVDFRFARHWGLFVDARYEMIDRAPNVGLGRVGFRFAL